MHLVYIDEVKFNPPSQRFHWLCALAFPENAVQLADRQLGAIANEFVGTTALSPEAELHAVDIVQGKKAFKGRSMEDRVELYKRLLDLISTLEELGRIEVRIEPGRMLSQSYADKAFMFLVECVERYMVRKKSIALLIADDDKEIAGQNVASLSAYKALGTAYRFGRPINRVVDTVHHTKSHHSRLLQLADVYVYTLAMVHGDCSRYPRTVLSEYAKTRKNLLFPSAYKNWPTESSWARG